MRMSVVIAIQFSIYVVGHVNDTTMSHVDAPTQ